MRHGHRLLIIGLGVAALAAALISADEQGARAEGSIIYVDADAIKGDNNGTSWWDALLELYDALEVATAGDQIWVAEGTYKPASGTDRTISFRMRNGVAIYGGFDPTVDDIEWGDRDWVKNVTVLSGDLDGDDLPPFGNNTENSYHVFYHPVGTNLDGTAILDGFTISGGNADGSYPHDRGGGMANDESSPMLSNVTFFGNSAAAGGGMANDDSSPTLSNCAFTNNSTSSGGGMYNWHSSPVLTGCTFSANWASNGGGGIYNGDGSAPTLNNCTFAENTTDQAGGGMLNSSSSPTLTGCTFSGNSATGSGGGMTNYFSSPALTGCTFVDNSTNGGGGGMINRDSMPTLTDCTFTSNSAGYGGGIYNFENAAPVLTGCIFTRNTANSGGGMYNVDGSSPTLTNCTFSHNMAGWGGGMTNFSVSPMLTNCTFWGNWAEWGGGGIYNYDSASLTLTNCTFWNNSADHNGGGINNELSAPTVTNCILWGDTPDEIYNIGSTPDVSYSNVEGSYPGTSNLNVAPQFVDPASGDFHLSLGSPCIDVGNNEAPDLPDYDFEGDDRILDGDGNVTAIVDMGVDEVAIDWPYFRVYLPVVLRNY